MFKNSFLVMVIWQAYSLAGLKADHSQSPPFYYIKTRIELLTKIYENSIYIQYNKVLNPQHLSYELSYLNSSQHMTNIFQLSIWPNKINLIQKIWLAVTRKIFKDLMFWLMQTVFLGRPSDPFHNGLEEVSA
jgi:hypothetical protein